MHRGPFHFTKRSLFRDMALPRDPSAVPSPRRCRRSPPRLPSPVKSSFKYRRQEERHSTFGSLERYSNADSGLGSRGTLPQTDALRRTTSYRVLDPRPAALLSCPSWRCCLSMRSRRRGLSSNQHHRLCLEAAPCLPSLLRASGIEAGSVKHVFACLQ
jgi:hypothetical protein